eukprot:2785939-Rhodomonas_salina.1
MGTLAAGLSRMAAGAGETIFKELAAVAPYLVHLFKRPKRIQALLTPDPRPQTPDPRSQTLDSGPSPPVTLNPRSRTVDPRPQ